MKTMQVFDCQDMPNQQTLGGNYDYERNLCSKFLRLNPEQSNDSIVEWDFISSSSSSGTD